MRGLGALALVLLAVAPALGAAPIEAVATSTDLNDAMMRLVAAQGGARPVTLMSCVGADPEARSYLAPFDLNVKPLTAALAAR